MDDWLTERPVACARLICSVSLAVPRQDISPVTIRRKPVQNIVEFHIIGRLGRIDAAKNVTHISVATNYNCREGKTWKSEP